MTPAGGTPLDRVRALERERSRTTLVTHGWVVGSALLIFTSFAIGHTLGPAPIRPVEVALGLSGALLIGLGLARPIARRRRDAGARACHVLHEGRAKRRALVYDDFVLLDDEPVLKESVDRVERTEGGLVLRYEDPVAGGPLLRELEGPARGLDAVADALSPDRVSAPGEA